MAKKGILKNNMRLIRAFAVLAILVYVLGIVPQFTDAIGNLFADPLVKIIFLAFVVAGGYLDTTIGTLLAIAFIASYLTTPSSPLYDVIQSIRGGTSDVVGGVGSGTQRLVGGVGSGAQRLVGGAGGGAQQLLGGVQRGAQELVGGVGSGTQQLLGGAGTFASRLGQGAQQALSGAGTVFGGLGEGAQQALGGAGSLVGGVEEGTQQLLGGVGGGAQQLLGGVQSGAQQLLGGASEGTQQLLGGLQSGTQQLVGGMGGVENLQNAPLSVSDAYQQHMYSENQGDRGCSVQPQMSTGCDPIVGYNAPYNCGCSGACGGNCEGLDPACLCKGVEVWKNQMNTQGLNFPQGYSGGQVGSTY